VLAALPADAGYVFHLATYHGNQSSMADPLADHENNTLTTLKLYERIKDFDSMERVVYASAGCTVAEKTFDEADATSEDAPVSLWLDSPYQISKIIGEYYSNYYFMRHGLPAVKARFQNVYGPREVLGAGEWRGTVNTVWRNVTPTFIYRSLKREALPVENGGIASRDFIYVDDIVEGLLACATKGEPGGVYNLASGAETTILELAELVNELTGNPTPIALTPARDWDHSGKRFGDPRKAQVELSFRAGVELRDGLERTIAWTRENLGWIEACMSRHAERVPELRSSVSAAALPAR
jgi:nucleoside-diphosphate-sugar epimerase